MSLRGHPDYVLGALPVTVRVMVAIFQQFFHPDYVSEAFPVTLWDPRGNQLKPLDSEHILQPLELSHLLFVPFRGQWLLMAGKLKQSAPLCFLLS